MVTTDLRRSTLVTAATNRAVQAWRTPDIRTYPAVPVTVHDGDTFTADIDLGFDTWHHTPVRLLGCNAREFTEPGGPEARTNLWQILVGAAAITGVTLATVKPDKFGGRYDAAVILPDGRDLVAWLCANEWAAAWDGVGQKPVPPWPRTITTEGT